MPHVCHMETVQVPREFEGQISSGNNFLSKARIWMKVPPFYLSLRIHQFILHNSMLDSGASHNLMPKAIMERLGLDIARSIMICTLDFGKVHCLGIIKDLVVYLDQILAKNVLMDVAVADIPPRFGMLFSRS